MKHGSVIIDLAAERGGNCALTEPGKTVEKEGVTIVGDLNWPSTVSVNASEMYAKNVLNILLDAIDKQGVFKWDYKDDIVDGAMICHEGEVHHGKVRELLGMPPLPKPEPEKKPESPSTGSGQAAPATGAAQAAATATPAQEKK
jgi:H+-translocating NAD(P) transhydrogenase subunit alpha